MRRRKKSASSGSLPTLDALAAALPLSSSSSSAASRPPPARPLPGRRNKTREAVTVAQTAVVAAQVATHPAFQDDPLQAIFQHINAQVRVEEYRKVDVDVDVDMEVDINMPPFIQLYIRLRSFDRNTVLFPSPPRLLFFSFLLVLFHCYTY